jgi:flagellar basal-body rod protein FlgB
MPISLNNVFDVHARSLGVSGQRLELLADNIANADTPGYKARDLDFRTAMQDAGGNLGLRATSARHIDPAGGAQRATPLYRVPEQPTLDGNTVDPQRENAAVAETTIRYQATLTFLSARIRGLRDAITGGR